MFALLLASPLPGHHTFRTMYDSSKPLDLKGVVTRIEWANPHVHFYVDVKDERSGEIQDWVFELSAPSELEERYGWTKDIMKIGDEVQVTGSRARSGCRCGGVRFLTMVSTGKRLGPIWG